MFRFKWVNYSVNNHICDVLALAALLIGVLLALSRARCFAVAPALWCLGEFWRFRRPTSTSSSITLLPRLCFSGFFFFFLSFFSFFFLGLMMGVEDSAASCSCTALNCRQVSEWVSLFFLNPLQLSVNLQLRQICQIRFSGLCWKSSVATCVHTCSWSWARRCALLLLTVGARAALALTLTAHVALRRWGGRGGGRGGVTAQAAAQGRRWRDSRGSSGILAKRELKDILKQREDFLYNTVFKMAHTVGPKNHKVMSNYTWFAWNFIGTVFIGCLSASNSF